MELRVWLRAAGPGDPRPVYDKRRPIRLPPPRAPPSRRPRTPSRRRGRTILRGLPESLLLHDTLLVEPPWGSLPAEALQQPPEGLHAVGTEDGEALGSHPVFERVESSSCPALLRARTDRL